MSKLKKSKKAFEEGRAGRSGGMVNLTIDQKCIVRLQSLGLDVSDDGVPYVQFNTVCVSSEIDDDIGNTASQRFNIKELKGKSKKTGKDYHITEADCFAQICTALQKFGYETDELELEELEELAETVSEEQPACQVTPIEKGDFVNLKFNKFIDDDDLPGIEDVSDVSDEEDEEDEDEEDDDEMEDEEDTDEDDEEEYEDADEDEDEENLIPTKGDTVSAKPKGTKKYEDCIVKTVSKAKETCTLKRERDDKLFKDVPWYVIEEADDDEDED